MIMESKVDLKFQDWIERIKNGLGKEQWVVVYSSKKSEYEDLITYSALIPNARIKDSLQDPSWDLTSGCSSPEFITTCKDGIETTKYFRFSEYGVEPLIIWRNFYGIRENYYEVLEEFRYYFNLFEDRNNRKYIAIDDNGDETDVILIGENEIKIELKYIKEFLALKEMKLAIFFTIDRFSKNTLEELGIEKYGEIVNGDKHIYSIGAENCNYINDQRKSFAWLLGKKLISGMKNFKPSIFFEETEYADFIIGIDEDGKEIFHTCNKDKISGANYLTPVFFRKEVLSKYYNRPDKYSVKDGRLHCANLWILKMDNNHPQYVMILLSELGNLPYNEQLYWKSYNIAQGKISHATWTRWIKGEWAEPDRSDLFFKQKFPYFQEKWFKKFGWYLFLPLAEKDNHFFESLRIPLTNEQKEFDEQVLSITKILIDSLNETELEKGIEISKDNPKGIDKFEAFLKSKHIEFEGMIEFLRKLQTLRSSGTAHRKGKNYEKIAKEFFIGEKEFPEIFDDILINAIKTLNSLEHYLLEN